MRKPTVFVSSTCYDLKQVRADLKQFIEEKGFESVLSDYDSFPVNPALGTVDNCLKAVEAKADIFVLIIGGRYGSTTEHGKSVTNLEHQTARAKGIPTYVFVVRSILDVLPIWKTNRSADFTSVVDSLNLFEFVAELRDGGVSWVFPFDTAQDICAALRTQLAYLFTDALSLRLRASETGALSENLHQLRGSALRLVIERPPAWEYLLLGTSLSDELNRRRDLRKDWEYGIALGSGTAQNLAQFMEYHQLKLDEARRIMACIETIFHQALPDAVGPLGVSGNPNAIVYVAGRIAAIYENLLEWKQDLRRLAVPPQLKRLRDLFGNFCDNAIVEIEAFNGDLIKQVKEAIAAASSGAPRAVNMTLKLTVPSLDEYAKEMDRVVHLVRSGEWE